MWQAGSRITLTKTSEVGQRNWGYEKMRRQLQIYAPPLDHCTSLKPEAASSGSVSVPAHTGCTRPPTRWFISAVVLNVFPRPARWELMRFTHVCQEIHFLGEKEHAIHLREKNASHSRLMSQTTQRHRSTAGRQNQWWMLTVTLSLNIPRYHWVLCSVIVLFNLILALQPLLHALVCCVSLF